MRFYAESRTNTAQDLMTVVEEAAERALEVEGRSLPRKTPLQRAAFEAPLNALGALVCGALRSLPADWALSFQAWVYSRLAAPYHYPFDAEAPALLRARAAVRGQALFAMISHPPVLGELSHLNFELVRHASLALRFLRGRPCRPRLVVAVDPFALDHVSLLQEGLYGGAMGLYHLGLDRLWFLRRRASRLLLGPTAWDRMPFRLLRTLNEGGEVGMVLSGGVPATTRVLYGVRDWLWARRRESPLRREPARVLARLRREPDFAAGSSPSAWRLMERWAMTAVAEESAETGRLGPRSRRAAEVCLEALGFAPEARAAALAELSRDLARETPFRARFFRVLAARLRRPALFLPVVHRAKGGYGVAVRDAWAWEGRAPDGRVRARVASEPGREWDGTPEEFAEEFVGENFQ